MAIRGTPAPGAAETVGDDHGRADAGQAGQFVAQTRGGAVRVEGKQQHAVGAADIGVVHAGIGHDEPQPVLHDEQVGALADDAGGFGEDDVDETRVLADLGPQAAGFRGWVDGGEVDQPAFCLGDDLLGEDDDVGRLEGAVSVPQARGDQCRQVITGLNQGKIGERKKLNEWRDRNSHQQPLP